MRYPSNSGVLWKVVFAFLDIIDTEQTAQIRWNTTGLRCLCLQFHSSRILTAGHQSSVTMYNPVPIFLTDPAWRSRIFPTVPMLSVTDRHCGCPRYHRTAERYSCCPRSADEAAHAWRLLRRWPAGNLRRPEYGKAVRTYAFAGGIVRTLRCCLKMYARP